MKLPHISALPFPAFYNVDNRYRKSTCYTHNNAQYCYSSDTMFTVALKNRTANSLIGGRVLAEKLSRQTPLTVEILTGELGGAAPIPDDHPLKAAAVRATALILRAGWKFAHYVADGKSTIEMDKQLIDNDELPSFIPKTFGYSDETGPWKATFTSMDLIFTLAGGQFTVPAGMAFHYHCTTRIPSPIDGGPQSQQFSLEVYFQSVPDDQREVHINGLRQLITDRNQIFELNADARLTSEINLIVSELKEAGLITAEIMEAAKQYDAAQAAKNPQTSNGDAAPRTAVPQ